MQQQVPPSPNGASLPTPLPSIPNAEPSPQQASQPTKPASEPSSAALQAAEVLRLEGNEFFSRGKLRAAVEAYTQGISMCSEVAALWVNRALSYKKLAEWDKVLNDAQRALQLQPKNMKAHYLAGLAMTEREQYVPAMAHLQTALEAARETNEGIKDEIYHALAKAKFAHWQIEAARRREQNQAYKAHLQSLIRAQLQGDPSSAAAVEQQIANLDAIFALATARDTRSEIPSLFVCPLTLEIMREPAITNSGHSYERTALLEHLKKVGRFDPVSRKPMTENDVVVNQGLRAAVQHYLEEHPWAWEECM